MCNSVTKEVNMKLEEKTELFQKLNSNGSFCERQREGHVKPIVERIIKLLKEEQNSPVKSFSEKALDALNGYYVYALVDPRNDKVFYIGKGIGNRVFSHEIESEKSPLSEI